MPNTFDPTNIDKVISFANTPTTTYRVATMRMSVANLIGSGAGASVTTAVTFSPAIPSTAQNIRVSAIVPDQDAVGYPTSVTNTGFNLVLNPRLAANTLAVGSNNVTVVWDI